MKKNYFYQILNPKILSLAMGLLTSAATFAQQADSDGAFLDPPYKGLQKLVAPDSTLERLRNGILNPFNTTPLAPKNDVLAVVALQSPVKAQGARGTCSIFSATALLENLLIKEQGLSTESTDLSEEWLEYIKASEYGGEGSTSSANIRLFRKWGSPYETALPYIGETWETLESSELALLRCANLDSWDEKRCLIGHRNPNLLTAEDTNLLDPELFKARNEALDLKELYLKESSTISYISRETEVKKLLSEGNSVLLDLDFYYGAWNHRVAATLGLNRNMEHWALGIVGYPELGSLDRSASKKEPAGHSILLVGYDDDKTVTIESLMEDGSTETFTYKGVYYFKNSWGQSGFGADAQIESQALPGYGMITQKYARDFGGFYSWTLKPKSN